MADRKSKRPPAQPPRTDTEELAWKTGRKAGKVRKKASPTKPPVKMEGLREDKDSGNS